MGANSPNYNIAVLESALKIFEAFLNDGREGKSLADLSKQTGLTKTRAFRILSTLQNFGYVHQDTVTHQYRLGLKLLQLGEHVRRNLELVEIARPVLTTLCEQTNETVFLGVLDGNESVCVDRRDTRHGIRLYAEIGLRTPLHAGTVPKILLAHQPAAFIEEYLSRPLVRFTERTIVDPQKMLELLNEIRQRDVTITRDDMDLGAVSVGAPIRDHTGAVVAALSVAGPEARFPPEHIQRVMDDVRQAANEIERRLGKCNRDV